MALAVVVVDGRPDTVGDPRAPRRSPIYESDMIRTVIGSLQAATFHVLKQGLGVLYGIIARELSLELGETVD